jgi:hypothetical protein
MEIRHIQLQFSAGRGVNRLQTERLNCPQLIINEHRWLCNVCNYSRSAKLALTFFSPKASEFPTIWYTFETRRISFAGLNETDQILFIKSSNISYSQFFRLFSNYF